MSPPCRGSGTASQKSSSPASQAGRGPSVAPAPVSCLHPAPAAEARDEVALGRLAYFGRDACVPKRGRQISAVALLKQHAARAVDDVGDDADEAFGKVPHGVARGQRLDRAQPFDAVVVAIGEEVAQDRHADLRARRLGRQHGGEDERAAEQRRHLEQDAPLPAIAAEQHAYERRRHQEDAARYQRHGVERGLVREPDVGAQIVAPHQRQQHQRHAQHVGRAHARQRARPRTCARAARRHRRTARRKTSRRSQ